MGTRKTEFKKRQKQLMSEWRSNALRYTKSLKSLEDSWRKLGSFPFELDTADESEDVPDVQDDDIVMWKQHIHDSRQQIYSSVEKLRDIQKAHKKKKSSPAKAFKASLKRTRSPKRVVHLNTLLKYLENIMVILDDQLVHAELTEQLITLGNYRVAGGELSELNATKLRDELVALNSRWNTLNKQVLSLTDKSNHFVQEVDIEYSKHALWSTKCQNMEQWMTESEKLIRQHTKIAEDKDTLKEQLEDNQEFSNEVQEYSQAASEVFFAGDKLVEKNRLDESDVESMEKINESLKLRWNALGEYLTERHNTITSRMREHLKEKTESELSPWRETTNALHKSLASARHKLETTDEHLSDSSDHETLLLCSADIKEVENQLRRHTNEELYTISNSSAEWINQKRLSPEEEKEVLDTINVLHNNLSELEESVAQRKEKLKNITVNSIIRSIEECELTLNDLDNLSLDNFSSVGSNITEVQRQLQEIQKFETQLRLEDEKCKYIRTRFDEAVMNEIVSENGSNRLNYRLKDLDWRWRELWREHHTNRQRMVQAHLVFSGEVMADIYNWLVEAEKRVDAIEISNSNFNGLQSSYARHRKLNEEMDTYEPTIRTVIKLGKNVVDEQLIHPESLPGYDKEMNSLEQRMDDLRKKASENEKRLQEAMTQCSQNQDTIGGTVEAIDTVNVAEVYAELETTPNNIEIYIPRDTLPNDEGFGDADSIKGTDQQEINDHVTNPKLGEFHMHMKDIYKWIDDSDRMVKAFYVGMDPIDASRLQRQIEGRCDDIENKQQEVDHICKLGKELQTESAQDPVTAHEIEEELVTLNKRWGESQDNLDAITDRGVLRRAPAQSGCCLMMALRRKLSTLCAYN